MSSLMRRFLEMARHYPVLASGSAAAGLTAGMLLGFRIIAPFIFS